LSLDTPDHANEVHQYKLYTLSKLTQEGFLKERTMCASSRDFFILFNTQEQPCDIQLPANSGIVDKNNWGDYFGPYAGRAFIYGVEGIPNINTANYSILQLIDGVGAGTAAKILAKRPFLDMEDAEQKTGIKRI